MRETIQEVKKVVPSEIYVNPATQCEDGIRFSGYHYDVDRRDHNKMVIQRLHREILHDEIDLPVTVTAIGDVESMRTEIYFEIEIDI